MRKTLAFVCSLLGAAVPASATTQAVMSCTQVYAELQASGTGLKINQLKAYYRQSLAAGDCSDAFRKTIGRRVAVAIANAAEQAVAAGRSLESQESRLTDSLKYHRLWQVLATLGDIAKRRQDFVTAADMYQQSLDAIADETATRKAPDERIIASIFKKAETSRLLADSYVAPTRNRAGEPSGLGAPSVRGFVPSKVAIPITFEQGTAALAPEGKSATADLMRQLQAQGSPDITVVGHTDAGVGATARQRLSENRAAAVKRFLLEAGYSGSIDTAGRGASEPYAPDDPSGYTERQRHRMDLRVELRR